jgi:hypothetical protein
MCGAFQTDRDVTEFGSHFEVSPGFAVKVKYCEMRLTLDVLQHRREAYFRIVPMQLAEARDWFRALVQSIQARL